MNDSQKGQRSDDAALDEWLAGDSLLSRRYAELGDEQPPADLDRQILASAAEASKLVPLERTTRRWGASIAVAATVLLCVSIVVNLSIQPEGPLLGEAQPQVEFADEPAVSRSPAAGEPSSALEALRQQTQPGQAPAMAMDEIDIEPKKQPLETRELTSLVESGRVSKPRVDSGLESVPARPSLASPPPRAADPPRDDQKLARAIELLRTRVSEPAPDREAADLALNEVVVTARRSEPDPLEAILAAWETDDPDLAWARLQAFLRDYPEHPFSREFLEPE